VAGKVGKFFKEMIEKHVKNKNSENQNKFQKIYNCFSPLLDHSMEDERILRILSSTIMRWSELDERTQFVAFGFSFLYGEELSRRIDILLSRHFPKWRSTVSTSNFLGDFYHIEPISLKEAFI
jgi:hypothetical protein